MAGEKAAKPAGDGTFSIRCDVVGVRPNLGVRSAECDLSGPSLWTVEGPLGPRALPPRALDLLDLAGGLYRVESRVPQRPTNPVREWRVRAPVRDVAFWTGDGGAQLASVLAFLSRARWTFTFTERLGAQDPEYETDPAVNVSEIILFSGGMDSACGAGVHPAPQGDVRLVSYYTNQQAVQRRLADDLGYSPPVQWRLRGQRGKEGMDLIRSLMFLTLGGVVAESFGASVVFQYENGVLAMAIPPAGAMVPTRHAHPELHCRLERLWEAVFGRRIEIRNPFGLLTKREAVVRFERTVGSGKGDGVLRQTQTCWRLAQPHVGGEIKTPGVHCGVCTPCIVRRTARPSEPTRPQDGWRGYEFDLREPSIQEHPRLGMTFRAYIELVSIVLNAAGDSEMIDDLPPDARALVGGRAGPTDAEAAAVLRRFAAEFCDTFEISFLPERV